METAYWQQQTDKPLYPNLVWSRPETLHGAGKLLIIGGQAQEFIQVADSYNYSEKAGAGVIRVLMPESTKKITSMLPNIEYAPSNASGSFSRDALVELISAASWADTVLLAGNLGKNSETNLMLDSFIDKYDGMLAISGHALESITIEPKKLFSRQNTIIIISKSDLQKIGIGLELQKPVTSSTAGMEMAEILHQLSVGYPGNLAVTDNNVVWNASHGNVVSTHLQEEVNLTSIASYASVWAMQHPGKIHEALSVAVMSAAGKV